MVAESGILRTICRMRLLAVIAAGLFAAGCDAAVWLNTDDVSIRLMAENRSWHGSYLFPGIPGLPAELPTGREVHVPTGAHVKLLLASRDFVSDFRISALALREFTAPYLPSEISFEAKRPGRYEIRGDEMCGLPHTERTHGWLVVEQETTYRAWIARRLSEEKQ